MRYRGSTTSAATSAARSPAAASAPPATSSAPYRFQHLEVDASVVMTNKSLTGPNRGYACGHLYFETERMMDLLARERLGLDPVEIRRRNLIQRRAVPVPHADGRPLRQRRLPGRARSRRSRWRATTSCGASRRRRARQAACSASAWRWRWTRPSRTWATWRPRSIRSSGPSPSTCPSRAPSTPPRSRSIRSAASSPSSAPRRRARDTRRWWRRSSPTSWALDAARRHGGGRDGHVHPLLVDLLRHLLEPVRRPSARAPLALAARKLKAKLIEYAAHLMERPADDLEFRDGGVQPEARQGPSYSIKDLAGRAHWNTESLPEGMEPGLQATAVFGFTGWRKRRRRPRPRELAPTPTASSPR